MPYVKESKTSSLLANDSTSVAVIGLACRFPGDAASPREFWDLLCKARSAYSEPDRFNVNAFHSTNKDKINTSAPRGAHFLRQDIAAFDASFFSISQSEAMAMDPQQRFMLEVAYEAFENAGLPLEAVAGSDTSCYIGNFTTDYREMLFRDPDAAPLYSMSGSGQELISNRLSWFYDLRGPSFTLGTACSSSLVALHQGCQSIRTGESSMAVVGASNLLLNPDMFLVLSNQNFLAQGGRCRSFDAAGDGYGRGEGFAAVILKNVNDALRDGDPIRAVIRGSGVNQDGKTKAITVPSAEAQANLIRSTYRSARLDLKDTNYFEAHGTGTKAGDPLELEGIAKTLGKARERGNNLVVGSVKSNIGHLESVAGLAGLIKAIFILENAMIPPNINFETPNPRIPFADWNIEIPKKLSPWPGQGLRRLSIQAFGYGGTNAHAILDDAYHYLADRNLNGIHFTKLPDSTIKSLASPLVQQDRYSSKSHTSGSLKFGNPQSKKLRLFVLSAQDKEGLKRQGLNFATHLKGLRPDAKWTEDILLRDLAFTLSQKRTRLAWRMCLVAPSIGSLTSAFEEQDSNMIARRPSKEPRIGFIFTGQGAQWPRMGMELLQYQVFRESIEDADEYLRQTLGCKWSALEELARDDASSNINLPAYSQPLCTILQIALVDLLESWNIIPSVMAGHSSGEIAGAYCLGALTKEDAWKAAYFRGLLSSQMKHFSPPLRGAMLAVGASEDEAQDWISRHSGGEVVVACINSPSSVTLSGSVSGIDDMQQMLKEAGVFARKLKVETAYHSPHMEMISVPYLEAMKDIQTHTANDSRRMYSAVTGGLADASELGSINWVRNLVSPVLFYDAVREMLQPAVAEQEKSVDVLLEIGPHSALRGPINQILKRHGIKDVDCQSVLSRGQDGVETALAAASTLLTQGVLVDVCRVNNDFDSSLGALGRPLVDLPSYSWNHSHTFWAESRISKQYRFREHPRHSLLGSPCSTYGESERHWRGFLRLSEEPWVRDHKIQTSILYPAAGYIAMAVEAASQVAVAGQTIRDFKLRDIQIIAPAVVTEDSDLEFILQLRPHLSGTRDESSTWSEFTVSSSSNGQDLRKNCFGLLLTEYQASKATGISAEKQMEDEALKTRYRETENLCQTEEDAEEFYKELSNLGLNYGSTFQNISHIRRGDGHSCCDVVISERGSADQSVAKERPHVLHPATLDAMFHAIFAAFKHNKGQLKEAMVPKSIDEITISANTPFETGTKFKGFSTASKYGFRELMGDLVMLDEHLDRPFVTLKNFHCTAIAGTGETEDTGLVSTAGRMYSSQVWKPALDWCSADEIEPILNTGSTETIKPEFLSKIIKSERLALYYIRNAVERISVAKIPTPHLQDLYDWMDAQLQSASRLATKTPIINGEFRCEDEEDAKHFQADLESESSECQALCKIGEHLEQIVIGKVDGGELLRRNDLLERAFVRLRGMDECRLKLIQLVNMIAHSNPDLSVLELGISTEKSTSSILASISPHRDELPPKLQYVFSSPSEVSLKTAQEHLKDWSSRIEFKPLALSEDFGSQGFRTQSFDLIIVSDLLVAAQDPNEVLLRLKTLLKPGGRLCLVQVIKPSMELSLVLQCLPGWRSAGAQGLHLGLIENDTLTPLLNRNGLSSEFTIPDLKDQHYHQLGVTVAKSDISPETCDQEITILERSIPSSRSDALASQLLFYLRANGYRVKRANWGTSIPSSSIRYCISLLELEAPFLLDLVEKDYLIFQELILHCSNLVWITALDDPAAALATGMFRSIRNETSGKRFRTLSLQAKSLNSTDRLVSLVGKIVMAPASDDEIREVNGVPEICRFKEDSSMNEDMSRLLAEGKESIELIPLGKADGPQKLSIRTQGMLDSLCLESDEISTAEIGDDELEIDVRATGMNFRDVMVTMGQIPDNLLGFEASGYVKRCGKNVSSFKTGDKVCTLGHGAHRTLFRNKAAFCQPIPDHLSFEEAATLPLVHCTAYYSLVHVARVRKGQSILIHAAAGGVGQSAIQLARHFGLEIFATVGSKDKRDLIQDVYGVESDHIFNSRDLSFAKGVMRMTNGRGVDCVINSLSGEALRQSWHCIAPFGTFIEIGMKDILSNTGLEMRPFLQDASFTFFNLKHVMVDNPELMVQIIEGTFDFLRRGIIKPVSPTTVYPLSDVENAFRLLQTGKHRGKIAITWSENEIVPLLHRVDRPLKLDSSATYLLVGGLGGLGRSLANLLASSGARHMCFISRSGSTSDAAQKLVEDLEKRQVKIMVYSCDIANEDDLAKALDDCSASMPAIKGAFQCAMVLRDTLFERMSYDQWTTSLRPKVQGSRNLHALLPHNLDFHITLSSFAGIFGNRSQSNYAAAGAFQDALAHHRRSQGFKAVTVDLGIMRDVGVIAEKGATDYLKEWEVPFGMRETEFHALMKKIIASEMGVEGTGNVPAQIINGLATGEAARMAGIRQPFYFNDPRFSILASTGSEQQLDASAATNGAVTLREQLGCMETLADAAKAVTDALVARVAKSLQTDRSEIDESRPLHSYGIDSLLGVEIANWVFKETKVTVSVFDILATVSMATFARGIAQKSAFFKEATGSGI